MGIINMVQEKRPRGRPRIYSTDAERKRAYNYRQKAKHLEMEKRVLDLEEILGVDKFFNTESLDPIFQLTYADMLKCDSSQLIDISNNLRQRIPKKMTMVSPLHVFVEDLVENITSTHGNEISGETLFSKSNDFFFRNQQYFRNLTILHLVEKELTKREEKKKID